MQRNGGEEIDVFERVDSFEGVSEELSVDGVEDFFFVEVDSASDDVVFVEFDAEDFFFVFLVLFSVAAVAEGVVDGAAEFFEDHGLVGDAEADFAAVSFVEDLDFEVEERARGGNGLVALDGGVVDQRVSFSVVFDRLFVLQKLQVRLVLELQDEVFVPKIGSRRDRKFQVVCVVEFFAFFFFVHLNYNIFFNKLFYYNFHGKFFDQKLVYVVEFR